MLLAVVAAPARLVVALLLQVAAEYGAGAGTGFNGAFRGVSLSEARQLWDANVPFPPWVVGAGVAALWGVSRIGGGGSGRPASGGLSDGVLLAVGLAVLYVLARASGVL